MYCTPRWRFDSQSHAYNAQFADKHFNVFPRTVAEVVDSNSVRELHVSLTQGRWKPAVWGKPIVSAPTGAELWAWFDAEGER